MVNDSIIAYCLTIFIASIIPGPSMLLALATGANSGWVAGAIAAIGNVIASTVQAVVALLVIFEIGNISEASLSAIKYAGAAYIIYMGLNLLKIRSFDSHERNFANGGPQYAKLIHLKNGFMFSIFNPKAILFFSALFPQFVNHREMWIQNLLVIFTPIWIIAFVCFMAYAVSGMAIMRFFGRSEHVGKVFGFCIIVAGVALLFT